MQRVQGVAGVGARPFRYRSRFWRSLGGRDSARGRASRAVEWHAHTLTHLHSHPPHRQRVASGTCPAKRGLVVQRLWSGACWLSARRNLQL